MRYAFAFLIGLCLSSLNTDEDGISNTHENETIPQADYEEEVTNTEGILRVLDEREFAGFDSEDYLPDSVPLLVRQNGGYGDNQDYMSNPLAEETLKRLEDYMHDDLVSDWENFQGPALVQIVVSTGTPQYEANSAFKGVISLLSMLAREYPRSPLRQLMHDLDTEDICSHRGNVDLESLWDTYQFESLRLSMYQTRQHTAKVALRGLSFFGEFCPDVIISESLSVKSLFLRARVLLSIRPSRARRPELFDVDVSNAFESSLPILLHDDLDALRTFEFVIHTKKGLGGTSIDLHDWFAAVNANLPNNVDSTAFGRFLGLSFLKSEPSLFLLPISTAEAIVGKETDAHADIMSDLVHGFHEIVAKEFLRDLSPLEIQGFLRRQPDRIDLSHVDIPLLSSGPPTSLLGKRLLSLVPTPASVMLKDIENHLMYANHATTPLERWTEAGGPLLLQLTYELLGKPDPDFWRAKVDFVKALMVLSAGTGAPSAQTGIMEFCRLNRFELEELLVGSLISESSARTVFFSPSGPLRASITCFAADWFRECPSVLTSTFLKGIAISHRMLRDIAIHEDRAKYGAALLQAKETTDIQYYGEEETKGDEVREEGPRERAELSGHQIGWFMIDQNSTNVPQFPLEVYQQAVSGDGPAAHGLRSVIPVETIAFLTDSVGLTAEMLRDIVENSPFRNQEDLMQSLRDFSDSFSLNKWLVKKLFNFMPSSDRESSLLEICSGIVRHSERGQGNIQDMSEETGLGNVCIHRPGLCLSVFNRATDARVLCEIPNLFPTFWLANQEALRGRVIAARIRKDVGYIAMPSNLLREITVRRSHVLEDSTPWLSGKNKSQLRIDAARFANEAGVGPGVFKDWFASLSNTLSRKVLSLRIEEPQYNVLAASASDSDLELFGRLVALSIAFDIQADLELPLMFYGALLPLAPDFQALLQVDDSALFNSYQQILGMSEDQLDGIELLDESITVQNRNDLIARATRASFQGHQMDKVMQGFSSIIEPSAFEFTGISTAQDLRLLVEGEPGVDIADMKDHIKLEGYDEGSDQIVWLFEFLESADLTTRRKFLYFVTSSSVVPVGGFAKNPITVGSVSGDDFQLPSAHTCSRHLDLPRYSSSAIVVAKLTISINADPGMGFV